MQVKCFLSIILVVASTLLPARLLAQNSIQSHIPLYVSVGAEAGTASHDVSPMAFNAALGWRFQPRMYVFAQVAGLIGLDNRLNQKAYSSTTNIGGGIGYNILPNHLLFSGLDLKCSVTASVGNYEWKNTAYKIGVTIPLTKKSLIKPALDLSYTFYNSRTSALPNISSVSGGISIYF